MVGALLAAVLGACRNEAAPAETPKPTVHVLTSLPLMFDEGFGLEPAKGEAAVFLRERFTLKPIDLPSQLPRGAVLFAAQPRALPAEELVALDKWVRDGGKLLLLADPMLEWPSERPIGDRLRPPVSFADTGLLSHWGLRLDAPDKRGPRTEKYGDFEMTYLSPGSLVKVTGNCFVEADALSASCDLGKGQATILADADLLNVDHILRTTGRSTDSLDLVSGFLSRRLSESQ
ncbi:MAG TPA: DUF4350 domain-containing protein [Sphingomicrobium sp.]|nr:DUF4350 domain-containing protein [Sphingomicrobium sp.]